MECPELRAKCQHVGQQQRYGGGEWRDRVAANEAGLEKHTRRDSDVRWSDHSEQDVLLRFMGTAEEQYALASDQQRLHRRSASGNLPLLGEMESRRCRVGGAHLPGSGNDSDG